MKKPKFRHELKYYINIADYFTLKSRLKHIASLDRFAGSDGTYKIRSLYFDTPENKALMEKLNGINHREKFRIRFYNDDPSFIKLEKKSKINSLCTKVAAAVTREQCEKLLAGDTGWLLASGNKLMQELYAKMKYQLMRPKTVVDYYREAYIYEPGNVRITIDNKLKSGLVSKDFFNPNLPSMNITTSGQIILEVKYDAFLPELIRDVIQTNERRNSAISKYAACRIYG